KGLAPLFDEFYGKLPILGIGLGFLAICDYLDIELIDLPKPFNGVNYPVILQNSNTIWQTAMNIPQLALSENGGINFTETYYDLHSDLLA
ncbi:carbamoyl phosphate synthase small subunit, partial [Veillonellaceae bacterium M2-4]|nr:carbamoyl phosphate synthase small subunit [Veillonellaceae bacterium M2-4]